jgi:hypothetical protein
MVDIQSSTSDHRGSLPSRRIRDLSNLPFGFWTVLAFSHVNKDGKAYWDCLCFCGAQKTILGADLIAKKSQSCGCTRRLYGGYDPVHLHVYNAFAAMWRRCTDPTHESYHNYGGRGIVVCERWRLFAAFFADIGDRPGPHYSLDRINNDGNYEPGNVRWATRREQANNTRRVLLITFKNETHTIADWARRLGFSYPTLRKRLRNWSLEDALTAPVDTRYSRSRRRSA